MDSSRTTHQLEETVDTFQKQKLKDLQVGVVCPLLEVLGAASCTHVCAYVSPVWQYAHTCMCTCARCVCMIMYVSLCPLSFRTVNPGLILAAGVRGWLLRAAVSYSWPARKPAFGSLDLSTPRPSSPPGEFGRGYLPRPPSSHTRSHRTWPDFLLPSTKLSAHGRLPPSTWMPPHRYPAVGPELRALALTRGPQSTGILKDELITQAPRPLTSLWSIF